MTTTPRQHSVYDLGQMDQNQEGVYLPTDDPDTYVSTEWANAGWYTEGQHGGALAALITGHVERVPTLAPMEISRVTVEIFRVVPLVPLTITTHVVREGKRIQKIRADVTDPSGTLLSMASVQRLRVAELPLPGEARAPDRPFSPSGDYLSMDPTNWGHGDSDKIMFHRGAIEAREIRGGFNQAGPGAIWIRLVMPIVAGRPNTAAQRAVAPADFCNGVSRSLGDDWVFMNSDLTVHVSRYPKGEWVALDAESHYAENGRGVASGSLWDDAGWIGRSAQTLFLDKI
jgi:hypothetical protein